MFEIYSDKGRSEKPIDLLSSGVDLQIQESTLKGLSKVSQLNLLMLSTTEWTLRKPSLILYQAKVSNVTEAQCVIAQGLLKRTTAQTNSNHESR